MFNIGSSQGAEIEPDELGKIHYIYVNDFSEESAKQFVNDFEKAISNRQDIIPVIIDSYGGSVDALTLMVDLIKSSPVLVATVCLGKAMSAGAMLLTCGAEGYRFASPNSRIMLHNISSFSCGKLPDMKIDLKEVERMERQMMELVAKNCKKSKNYFSNLLKKNNNADLYLTPTEAKKHNIVNRIGVPHFRTELLIKSEIVV